MRDDGRGIDPQVVRGGSDGHWGITGMRERAKRIGATLKIRSRADAGTEVELRVPGPRRVRARRAGCRGGTSAAATPTSHVTARRRSDP